MQGTESTGEKEDKRVNPEPIAATAQTFSELESKNQLFRRIAWAAALLLVGVITILVLELTGIIPY